jgi:hypothetical protein
MHIVTPSTPYAYKMCVKLKKKEGLQCLSPPTLCWHINEKTHLPGSVNIQKLAQLKGKTCPFENRS